MWAAAFLSLRGTDVKNYNRPAATCEAELRETAGKQLLYCSDAEQAESSFSIQASGNNILKDNSVFT